jgi:DNA mismatch repair protein MutL
MGKIKILSEEVANRIAAGEVIERPVSVVKELVENSIDSGADQISIFIENGGKSLIQVIDNGCGMTEDDALQSFERHATSKIKTVSDIFNISSLGFRGEALPSIASVSELNMVTRHETSDTATKIDFSGGRFTNLSQASANKGTSITVKRIFFNIPARKKFLKSNQVEYKHILNYIHYQSIIYPNIHFKFISNGKEKLNYPIVEDKLKRMQAIFGSDFHKKDMFKVDSSKEFVSIEGYIGGLETDQEMIFDYRYIFVNGRYIKDKIILHAVKTAYEPFIKKYRIFQQGKTPPYILFINIDPAKVDFNVHPAKLEIRFTDPGIVHTVVKNTLTNSLLEYENEKYANVKQKLATIETPGRPTDLESRIFTQKTDRKRFSDVKKEFESLYQPDIFKTRSSEDIVLEKKLVTPKSDLYLRPEEEIINPWQLHQSYIFVQIEEGLMIIDQHAAHERILYEKILHRIHGAPAQSQKLLFPLVIDLPPYLTKTIPQLISDNLEIFHKIGFSLKSFSGNSVVIDEIPVELENWDGGDVFIDILKTLEEEFEETEDFRDSISKSVACKAAVKAGKKMGRKEMLALINDLFACEVPYYCPHGRPLIIKMTMTDFEKKFKRI